MIYGLQIFIFLRRLLGILFAPIPDFSKVYFEKDLLNLNSEFAFYFLEGLLSYPAFPYSQYTQGKPQKC